MLWLVISTIRLYVCVSRAVAHKRFCAGCCTFAISSMRAWFAGSGLASKPVPFNSCSCCRRPSFPANACFPCNLAHLLHALLVADVSGEPFQEKEHT